MKPIYIPALAAGLCLVMGRCHMAAEPECAPLSAVQDDEGVFIREGDQPVLFYQSKPRSLNGQFERAGYVHPLYDLNGIVLTEDFPDDHRHHRGIFWAWHQIWVGDMPAGDPWLIKDFAWRVSKISIDKSVSTSLTLKANVVWMSPRLTDGQGNPRPLIRETTRVTVHQSENNRRIIDFQIGLLAHEEEIRLGGSDDEKGYGGFSARIRLPDDTRFTGPQGRVTPQKLSVEPSPWMDITGTFDKAGEIGGVSILCHPSLPGFPQRWILRQQRSMQNPVYPGRQPVPLSNEIPLVLSYRMVVHRGRVEPSLVEQWQSEYAAHDP